MEFKNKHIRDAYDLISTLSVSHDAVDIVFAAKQQLIAADREFSKPPRIFAEKLEPKDETDKEATAVG